MSIVLRINDIFYLAAAGKGSSCLFIEMHHAQKLGDALS